ncbi:MAG: SpoIIE family protein phosphatase [Bacteroidia bacterium]|nr:SpoIIE family protein phosphatase [Bacteroidia bacterium]
MPENGISGLIPPQLKKIGFEIIRPDEISTIDAVTIKKLARAIHSRYLQEIRKNAASDDSGPETGNQYYPGDLQNQYSTDYETLYEETKISNKDNAFHIPTKLLSIGYKMRRVKKGFKAPTLHLNPEEIETMARVEHIRWSWDKRLNGWIYGNVKDNSSKIHPGLIPFEELAEHEKEKDRELVRLIPALLHDIDYEAYPVNPDQIKNLSYSIKPHSSIHKLLIETRRLNEEMKEMAASVPEINEKIRIINRKIEESINEVQGSYNYARHIQKTFLPDDLYVRECFPDSFVMYKPKDIVGGDFYFFSHTDNQVVFAAADCTGHGIPGALLSTIGYGITDQAVNELKITAPDAILQHLYSRVHRFLRWDEDETGLSDEFYHVSKGEIRDYLPLTSATKNSETNNYEFPSETIQLIHGDTIYLCSDGYADQFGGPLHKKFQRTRFKSLLLSIQALTMTEQSDILYEEIEKWREENDEDQTDDILVIGVRI